MPRNQSANKEALFYKKALFAIGSVAILLFAVAATAYFTSRAPEQKTVSTITHTPHRAQAVAPQPAPVQQAANCDDGNVVGLAAGGLVGGLLGNQVGKGSGNTAATIGGAVGGAYLGKEHLPTKNVTCR